MERKKSEAEMKALLRKYDTEDQKKAGEAEVMEVDVVEDGPEEVCLDDTSDSVYSMADDISVTPSAV